MSTCEFCQKPIVKVWTSEESERCIDTRNEDLETYCTPECCRCNFMDSKPSENNCNCCFCVVGDRSIDDHCHYCNHGFCGVIYDQKLGCTCDIGFGEEVIFCIYCIAEKGNYYHHRGQEHHAKCMLEIINIGRIHRLKGYERLKFNGGKEYLLQEFYDTGYYGVDGIDTKPIKGVE